MNNPPVREAAGFGGESGRKNAMAAAAIVLLGVATRVAFVRRFPVYPVSDSINLVAFGRAFSERGLLAPSNHWTEFNPGLPMILAALDRIFPYDPAPLARAATAVALGLLGLIPFLLWRGVLRFGWRLCAGLILALWPGQVFFSGIVVQDNWVLLPGVALCALAVRRLRIEPEGGRPIAAGLLFVAALAIRQEMVVVLLPPLLAASGVTRASPRRRSRLWRMSLTVSVLVLLLAGQRYAATGRFTIATEHAGLALLGAFVPGSFTEGWFNPRSHIAQVEPTLFADPIRLRTASYRLVWEEVRRHPVFHLARLAATVPHLALVSDAQNLARVTSWPRGLPPEIQPRAQSFRRNWDPILRLELALIQGLFLATVILAIGKRDAGILVITAAILLKVGIHVVLAPMSRLMVPAIAFEILVIPLGAAAFAELPRKRQGILLGVAAVVPMLLLAVMPSVQGAILSVPLAEPRLSRFSLAIDGGGVAECALEAGTIVCLDPREARLETGSDPGDAARAVCRLPPLAPGEPMILRLKDTYSPGGWPDRMIARVKVDGRQILRRDLAAAPGGGWIEVPLHASDEPPPSVVAIEEVAVNPDAGAYWGPSCPLDFAFRR